MLYKYYEQRGDLIEFAKKGMFDVIVHGCNCMCTQGAGIAVRMRNEFGTDKYHMENPIFKGDINKLGNIEYEYKTLSGRNVAIVNAYTQYKYGPNHPDGDAQPLSYEALIMCLRKINYVFAGKEIGLPQIGAGLAGGDWDLISPIIKKELKDCSTTIVIYKNK